MLGAGAAVAAGYDAVRSFMGLPPVLDGAAAHAAGSKSKSKSVDLLGSDETYLLLGEFGEAGPGVFTCDIPVSAACHVTCTDYPLAGCECARTKKER